jgi:hypothetical protein
MQKPDYKLSPNSTRGENAYLAYFRVTFAMMGLVPLRLLLANVDSEKGRGMLPSAKKNTPERRR